jgi:hypothetical protein
MPVRTIDTRSGRPIGQRGLGSRRSGQPVPRVPTTPPDGERDGTSTDRPFDDWPFDFDPAAIETAEGDGG